MRPASTLVVVVAAALLASTPARAATVVDSPRPETQSLTVYYDRAAEYLDIDDPDYPVEYDPASGLALVSEWRTVEVPAGETVIRFEGVAEGIVPQTATLDGLPAKLIESNQDYDLLSPGSLVRKSVGTSVKRITTNPVSGKETVEDAVIRSGPDGVMLEVDGKLEAIKCGGPPQRLVFPRAPEGLSDKPSLSLRVNVERAGRYRVKLTYLATGVLWRARYVMSLTPDGRGLGLTGWITLINTSNATFTDAPTQVVAGDVMISDDTQATVVEAEALSSRCWPMDTTTRGRKLYRPLAPPPAPAPMSGDTEVADVIVTAQRKEESLQDMPIAVSAFQSELGDYKLYTLPSPTTVASRQTKQVLMVQRPAVKVQWLYVLEQSADDDFGDDEDGGSILNAVTTLKGENTLANGLGAPLPGGAVTFMQPGEDGRPLLVGEGRLRAAPIGNPFQIALNEDEDVRVRAVTLDSRDRGDDTIRRNRIEISNAKAVDIVFEYRLRNWSDEPFKILAQSRRSQRTSDGVVWRVKVPAGGTASFTYTIRSAY